MHKALIGAGLVLVAATTAFGTTTNGDGGNHGGTTVSAPVAAPGFSDSGVAPVTVVGSAPGKAQAQTVADAAACEQPFAKLIRANTDGSFTYGGLEYETPKFAQCMKAKGYRMGTPGEPSTNFGTR